MLDSLTPLIEHWFVFLPLLALIAVFYLLERKIKKGKTIFTILNLLAHAALLVLCFVFNTGIETALMLLLAAVLMGIFI